MSLPPNDARRLDLYSADETKLPIDTDMVAHRSCDAFRSYDPGARIQRAAICAIIGHHPEPRTVATLAGWKMSPAPDESEGYARKHLIDPQIKAQGWEISPYAANWPFPYDREAVEALFSLADTIERRMSAATARIDRLSDAILARVFRGELVPTGAEMARWEGRNYEHSSVLVGRIRAERKQKASSEAPRGKTPMIES